MTKVVIVRFLIQLQEIVLLNIPMKYMFGRVSTDRIFQCWYILSKSLSLMYVYNTVLEVRVDHWTFSGTFQSL